MARDFQDMPLAALDLPPTPSQRGELSRGDSMDHEAEGMTHRVSSAVLRRDDGSAWTRTTADADLVQHLLELYFTWIHPIHMVLSEPHFRTSFDRHDGVYCSPALVNVICAMATHLLEASPDDESELTYEAAADDGLGDRFMDEGRSLIKPEDYAKLTTIQAFAIMLLADAASGKALKASSYIRFANSSLADEAVHHDAHRDAWQVTQWGVRSLNVCVSPSSCLLFFVADHSSNSELGRSSRMSGPSRHRPSRPTCWTGKDSIERSRNGGLTGRWRTCTCPRSRASLS